MKIILPATILFALLCFAPASAQNAPPALLEKFFNIYETAGSDAAINYVFSTNKYLNQNQDGLTSIKSKLGGLLQMVGEYHGYEFTSNHQMGDSYRLYNVMVKYSRQPVQFTFILYRPGTTWHFQNFMYNPNVDDILEEKSKLSL